MVDLSRYTEIIPSQRVPDLRRDLSRIPDFSWLLSKPHQDLALLQGDLLREFPAVFLDANGEPRRKKFTVMVLNNSCDLPVGRLDAVTVAPVLDLGKYEEAERKSRSPDSLRAHIDAIRRNNVTELFYLPIVDGFPNGAIALLHMVCSVSSALYHNAAQNNGRVASFTQNGFYFLLIKLTNHIARPESDEVSRTVTH